MRIERERERESVCVCVCVCESEGVKKTRETKTTVQSPPSPLSHNHTHLPPLSRAVKRSSMFRIGCGTRIAPGDFTAAHTCERERQVCACVRVRVRGKYEHSQLWLLMTAWQLTFMSVRLS